MIKAFDRSDLNHQRKDSQSPRQQYSGHAAFFAWPPGLRRPETPARATLPFYSRTGSHPRPRGPSLACAAYV